MKLEELKQYKLLENKLNEFFKATNFCMDECITQETSLYYKGIDIEQPPGNIGCCLEHMNSTEYESEEYFGLTSNMKKRKDSFFSKQKENIDESKIGLQGNCAYHSKTEGCLIKEYKVPVCISFICQSYKEHLEEKYNINYNKSTNRKMFNEIIFIENTTSKTNEDKLLKLDEAIKRVKNHKEGQKYNTTINI